MIKLGRKALNNILPNESPDQEVNMSQLSLIWPYNIISRKTSDIIIARITKKLAQEHGLNRYLDDSYYRSENGISGEWPLAWAHSFAIIALIKLKKFSI